jgi:hypothetical protein
MRKGIMTELVLTLTEDQILTLGANVANDLSEIRQALSLWTDNHPNTTPPELFARHIDALSAVNKQLRDRKAEQKEGAR